MVILVPKNKKYQFQNKILVLKFLQNILIIVTQFLVLKKLCPKSSGHYSFFAIDLQYQLKQKWVDSKE